MEFPWWKNLRLIQQQKSKYLAKKQRRKLIDLVFIKLETHIHIPLIKKALITQMTSFPPNA